MTSNDELDPLADLLSSASLPPTDAATREAIFAQTRGVLRRRRWLRRGSWAAAFAACYAIGVLSGRAWQPARANNQIVEQPAPATSSQTGPEAAVPNPAPATVAPSSEVPQSTLTQSETSGSFLTTFEKLRRAGDRQLNGRGNLQGAIGCYRRALDYASDDELQIVPERDSWLLITLKEARLEARKHDHKKS